MQGGPPCERRWDGMANWKKMAAAGFGIAAVSFLVGRSIGPRPIEFPDPDQAIDAPALEEKIREALAEPRSFPRMVTLHRLFLQLTPQNVSGARVVFEEELEIAQSQDVQAFLAAWTQIDPYAAFSAVLEWKSESRRQYGIGVIVREWAASGGQVEALTYLRQQATPAIIGNALPPLVRGWAQSGDIDGAARLAVEVGTAEEIQGLTQALVRGASSSMKAGDLLEWAEGFAAQQESEFGDGVLRATVTLLAADDPMRSLRWYEENSERPWAHQVLPDITGHWAVEDPVATISWLLARPQTGPELNRSLSGAMQIWSKNHLEGAQRWLEEQPSLDGRYQLLLPSFLKKLAIREPKTASEWVDRLNDPKRRSNLIKLIAGRWNREDPDAVRDWLRERTETSSDPVYAEVLAYLEAVAEPSGAGEGDTERAGAPSNEK